MNTFISCDWGTSAFRLRLADSNSNIIVGEIKTDKGIAAVYNNWKEQASSTERIRFYIKILSEGISELEKVCNCSLANVTIVVSGMASSSIGMIELPYKSLPFSLNGSDLLIHEIPATSTFQHNLLFISGVRTEEDVMRGEETKLVGIDIKSTTDEQLIIIPGTHAKHVVVKNGIVTQFQTYMTGEIFHLLSSKSVLASSIEINNEEHFFFFLKGVKEASHNNFLNSIFHVRTYCLFDYNTSKQNYHYLSGLVIGSELKDLIHNNYSSTTLVSTGVFTQLYTHALQALGLQNINCINADEALLNGQRRVLAQHKHQS